MNILVLDVGTSSMRGTLMDEHKAVRFRKQVKYQPTYGPGGTVEQDPQDWVKAMTEICAVAAACETVEAVAMTSQRSSVIPADCSMKPVAPAVMWQDSRNREVCARRKAQEDYIRQRCGTGVNTVFSGGKIAWLQEMCPEVRQQTTHYFVVPEYLIYVMTGNAVLDYTYGSRSMLMDLRECHWSPELLALFHVESRTLGKLIPPSSVAGHVSERFAHATGLREGIPVITCGGDQQCGALGQGVIRPGMVSVNLGTGAYLIAATDHVPDELPPAITCNCSSIPGSYILEYSTLTCCAALDWFFRIFGGDVSCVGDALRKSPLGANGVTCRPFFQGTSAPDWDSSARAEFSGISLATTKEDLLRGLLEGICREIGNGIAAMEAVTPIDRVVLSGGLTKTPEVVSLMGEIIEKTVVAADTEDATTQGAWLSAMTALGIVSDWTL